MFHAGSIGNTVCEINGDVRDMAHRFLDAKMYKLSCGSFQVFGEIVANAKTANKVE